jgi:hypothetical protein
MYGDVAEIGANRFATLSTESEIIAVNLATTTI